MTVYSLDVLRIILLLFKFLVIVLEVYIWYSSQSLHLSVLPMLCYVTQSCPTLFDPVDCSPPGSSVHGDSLGNNNGEGCRALLQAFFPTQGLNPGLPHCQWILFFFFFFFLPVDSLLSEPPGEPILFYLSEANYIVYSSGGTYENNVFESYISILVYQEPLCLTAICLTISWLTFLCTT